MVVCVIGFYVLVLVFVLMYVSYKVSDYVEEKQNQFELWINSFCDMDGVINIGFENVNINGKFVVRVVVIFFFFFLSGVIFEILQGEFLWGDIVIDLFELVVEKVVLLVKVWGNVVIILMESNVGFMDCVSVGVLFLFFVGLVLMEFVIMVGGCGEIKKDVDFLEVGEDMVFCDKENKLLRIVQGSSNVFINNQFVVCKGDKLECSVVIVEGLLDVFIGGEQVIYLDIQLEFLLWQRMILGGIMIVSYFLLLVGLLGKLGNLVKLGKLGNLLGKSGKLLGVKFGVLLGKIGKLLKSIVNKVIRWVIDFVDLVIGVYCDECIDFILGQIFFFFFICFYSLVLLLYGLMGVGWSDFWSEYVWVCEQGNWVDIISLGVMLNFVFDGESDMVVNLYYVQYILCCCDDYLELFDRDVLSSCFFYDVFLGMCLCYLVIDDISDDCLVYSFVDWMYMLGGMSDIVSNCIMFECDSQYWIMGVSYIDGIWFKLMYYVSGYLKVIYCMDNGIQMLVIYEQDVWGWLIEVDVWLDYYLFYEYDVVDWIICWFDNDQMWSCFIYDVQGWCVIVIGVEGYYNVMLDYGDGCIIVMDGKGIYCYYYDFDGNILWEVVLDGSIIMYEWDEFYYLLVCYFFVGWVEKFEYNVVYGQLSCYMVVDGVEWQYCYDECGLFSNIIDFVGQMWIQQCDECGLLVSLVLLQGEEIWLVYIVQGLLLGIFCQDEWCLGIEYDYYNWLEIFIDVMGCEYYIEYSGYDLLVKMCGFGGQLVWLQWQQYYKLSGIEWVEIGVEGFCYDCYGNLLVYMDGNGVVWIMEYGLFDLLVV